MLTSANKVVGDQVAATRVSFEENILRISLSDGREVRLPIDRIEFRYYSLKRLIVLEFKSPQQCKGNPTGVTTSDELFTRLDNQAHLGLCSCDGPV